MQYLIYKERNNKFFIYCIIIYVYVKLYRGKRSVLYWKVYWLKRISGNVKASKKYEEMVQVGENTPLGAIFIFHRFSIQLPWYWTIYSTLLVVYSVHPSFVQRRKTKYMHFHYGRSFRLIQKKENPITVSYIKLCNCYTYVYICTQRFVI